MRTLQPSWKVALYVLLVIAAPWGWFCSFRMGFHPGEPVAISVLMWIPGLLAIAFRLFFREGFHDVGWRVGQARFWFIAYLVPLALASVCVFTALVLRKITLDSKLSDQTMLDALYFKLSWFTPGASNSVLLLERFFAVAFIMTVPGFFCAFGEELGWRGYLLPRMIQAHWPYPLVLTGVIWGIWHLPLFVFTGYAHGRIFLSILMFVLLTVLFGIFIGWLRLACGSVFVAAMAHASFNGFVQSLYGASFVGDAAWFWIGDYGILTLISYAGLVGWLAWAGKIGRGLDIPHLELDDSEAKQSVP
jgi:membrane protease YdiL (CAAX protease family)